MTDAAFSEAGEAYAPARYEYALDKHGNGTQRTMYRWVERLGRYENEGRVTTRGSRTSSRGGKEPPRRRATN